MIRELFERVLDRAREAALEMLAELPGERRKTVGADKACDTNDFVERCRQLNVTPHVAQNTTNRASRIDERTTRHPGYALSQIARKLIETVFGDAKQHGTLRQVKLCGLDRVGVLFTLAATVVNLRRLPKLLTFEARFTALQARFSTNCYASAEPQTIEMSFMLDTLSGTQGSAPDTTGCLQFFSASGATISNISVQAGGNTLWSGSGASGGYGDQALAGGCTDSAYSAYLDFRGGDDVFRNSNLFLFGGMEHQVFAASADLMAELLMGLSGSASFTVSGNWGKLRGQVYWQCAIDGTGSCVNIAAVPLPATAWRLGTALGVLAISRTRRKD